MFRVIDRRDTRKTMKLLTKCSIENGLYVCKHPERVEEKCLYYGIFPIPKTVGYEQFIKKPVYDGPVYIDELENFAKVLYTNLDGYCLTNDED